MNAACILRNEKLTIRKRLEFTVFKPGTDYKITKRNTEFTGFGVCILYLQITIEQETH